ncbi:MAG: DUF4363 family protein [Clostridia bacterium]|nr:DUF4363 family protein [Clostridia bacterium]
MKQTITMIICAAIIVVGGVCEIKYFDKSSIYLRADMDYIQNAIENENYELANKQIEQTYNSWENTKNIWNIFITNDEIDNIDDAMAELKKYSQYEEQEESLVAVEKIKTNLEHAVQRQKLRIDNVL